MKFYLCGGTSQADFFESVRLALESRGHEVTSRWHTGELGSPRLELNDAEIPKRAYDDLEDVDKAETLIYFSGPTGRGGKHYETGYAKGHSLEVWLVGELQHAFHTLSDLRFQDWAECLSFVEQEMS